MAKSDFANILILPPEHYKGLDCSIPEPPHPHLSLLLSIFFTFKLVIIFVL